MNTLKLHTFAMRFAYGHKEAYILCAGPQEAQEIYERLMPVEAAPFKASKAGWAFVDMKKAEPPATARANPAAAGEK